MESMVDEIEMRQYVLDQTEQCKNDAKACYNLGKLFLIGMGEESTFKVDLDRAKHFFGVGCEKKNGKSCSILSGLYREEKKEKEANLLWSEAQRLLTKECEFDNQPNSCMFWGLELLSNSTDPVRDFPVALRFLKRGCKLGQPICCLNAGVIYSNYISEPEKARIYFEKGCNLQNGDACWLLGEEIDKSESKEVNESTTYYKKACELNSLEGCVAHGTDMIKQQKFDLALESLTRACEQGEPNGCLLGGLLLVSTGNKPQAEKLLTKGCQLGNQESCDYIKQHQ